MSDALPELFRTIADYTYDWEAWVDASGCTRWINPALERITGYRVDEWLARADYPLALADPQHRPLLARVLSNAAEGGSGNDVEFQIVRRDGERRWVAISWQAVRTPDGLSLGYRTSIRDIEQRKRTEAELHVMRKRAEAAAIARSELLANVSHELRSPLHCIAGFAELLSDTRLDGRQRRYVELITRECAGMARHVEDLLQLAALEAGGLQLERRAFDLAELVQSAIEGEQPRASARGLTLELKLELAQRWVTGDPTRIGQVLRNLLDNALKFTDRGGVQVVARSVQEQACTRVELQVADSGSGMSESEVERLLEPFQQASGTAARRHGGVGLGLSIVRRLVSAMQGTLTIASQPGLGSSIQVVLCLAPALERARPELRRSRGVRKQGARCALVVDDSASARELLRAMLEREGYAVVEADSGRAALTCVASRSFDLVLLDYQMPDLDGAETAVALRRALAAQTPAPETAIHLLTANVFAREQLELGRGAIDGVLEKPLSRAALGELLSRLDKQPRPELAPQPSRARRSQLDRRVLHDLSELRAANQEPLLRGLLERTRAELPNELRALERAVAADDMAALAACAHRIAGLSATVGARVVARRARALEQRAANAQLSPSAAQKQSAQLARAWSLAEAELVAFASDRASDRRT